MILGSNDLANIQKFIFDKLNIHDMTLNLHQDNQGQFIIKKKTTLALSEGEKTEFETKIKNGLLSIGVLNNDAEISVFTENTEIFDNRVSFILSVNATLFIKNLFQSKNTAHLRTSYRPISSAISNVNSGKDTKDVFKTMQTTVAPENKTTSNKPETKQNAVSKVILP